MPITDASRTKVNLPRAGTTTSLRDNLSPKQGITLSREKQTKRHFDFSNLPTSKLPDLEPAVPPDSFLTWKYIS